MFQQHLASGDQTFDLAAILYGIFSAYILYTVNSVDMASFPVVYMSHWLIGNPNNNMQRLAGWTGA